MIIKELGEFVSTDPKELAGHKAETQMAYYLHRRFYNDKNIHVINGLRFLALDGEYSQIDHLVITQYFMAIIESKSVTSRVKSDQFGQWQRIWNGHWTGMPNPIRQIDRQKKALRDLLQSQKEQLRSKAFFGMLQGGFINLPIVSIVAISDTGIYYVPKTESNIVFKADLIDVKIEKLYKEYKKKYEWSMPEKDVHNVIHFLLDHHVPSEHNAPIATNTKTQTETSSTTASTHSNEVSNPQPVSSTVAIKSSAPEIRTEQIQANTTTQNKNIIHPMDFCPECHGKLKILWGYNYYWHCGHCQKNFPINHKCPRCKEKLHIRKDGNSYYIYCKLCKKEKLYFVE